MAALFPRGTRLLFANGFLGTIPMGFLLVVLPLYLARAGLEPAFIGLLYTISGTITALLVAFSGILADRFGRRRFLIAGTALPIVSYLILALTTDRAWLVIAATLGGVGLANGAAGAMTVASYDAMFAERTTPERRTRVFAVGQAVWNLALATGAATAGVPELLRAGGVEAIASYRPAFIAATVLAVIATLLLIPLRDLAHGEHERTGWLPRRSARPIAVYALGIGMLGFGFGVAVQLMPLWLNLRFGATEADLAPWYTLSQLLPIASVVVVPWLERLAGPSRSIFGIQLASGVMLASIVAAPVFAVAAALFTARSFLTNISWPFQQSLLMGAVEPRERASAAGIGFAVWGFANAVGPGLAGVLLGTGVLALPLFVGAAAYAGCGLVFGIGFGRVTRTRALEAPASLPG